MGPLRPRTYAPAPPDLDPYLYRRCASTRPSCCSRPPGCRSYGALEVSHLLVQFCIVSLHRLGHADLNLQLALKSVPAEADAVDLFRRGLLPTGSAFGSSMFRSVFGFGGTVDPTHSPSFRFPMMR